MGKRIDDKFPLNKVYTCGMVVSLLFVCVYIGAPATFLKSLILFFASSTGVALECLSNRYGCYGNRSGVSGKRLPDPVLILEASHFR